MTQRTLTYNETETARLDRAVSVLFEVSRNNASVYVTKAKVALNGVITTKRSTIVSPGDKLTLSEETQTGQHPTVVSRADISIIFEDEHTLVLNKPQGTLVHNAPGNSERPVIADTLMSMGMISSDHEVVRPGIVHRLDKDTTGLLLVAKTPEAHRYYSGLFHDRTITKTYVAVAHGAFAHRHAMIEGSIGRSLHDRTKMSVTGNGRNATSEIFRDACNEQYSLLRIILHTGRTHQIRVHLSATGHPIVGDLTYGQNKDEYPIMLHAHELTFVPYQKTEAITLNAPIPKHMSSFIQEAGLAMS